MPLAANQLLKYNGTKWTNASSALSEQSDVLISTPSVNQVLTYNGTKWVNNSNNSTLIYQGSWNARTNTPALTSGVGTNGVYYRVTVSGSTSLDGISTWRYNDIVFFNGSAWDRLSGPIIPSVRDIFYGNYNYEMMKRYFEDISVFGRAAYPVVKSFPNPSVVSRSVINLIEADKIIMIGFGPTTLVVNPSTVGVSTLTFGSTSAYYGAGYHPLLKRYYLSPYGDSSQSQWYYFDKNGNNVAYTHGASVTSIAYSGAVWSPTQSRLYFVPFSQASNSQWHYIDSSGSVIAYTHGVTASAGAYLGGVYSPTQNRIYFMPAYQTPQAQWHYIDCNTGSVVAYTHGTGLTDTSSYVGGVYSPTQNRIYFVPFVVANQPQWHYIDCNTGSVVAYTHGATVITSGYQGGVFVPTQNRIYFAPSYQAEQPQWHYIDCYTGSVVAFNNGVSSDISTQSELYCGATYSPTQDRVFFGMFNGASTSRYHYIDCMSGSKSDRYITV